MTLVRSVSLDGKEGPDRPMRVTPREGAKRKQRVLDAATPVPDAKGPHKKREQ